MPACGSGKFHFDDAAAVNDPSVWTGRVLQAGRERWSGPLKAASLAYVKDRAEARTLDLGIIDDYVKDRAEANS
jgi:hypothetical protein